MEKDLISVIVPVYNIEKYVGECLQSIIEQTYTNLEIIVVDDGSKDNSGSICDEFAKKDNRIKVFHCTNGGVSKARNTGLNKANGKWITFIDGDDWLDTTFCEKLLDKTQNADIVFSRMIKDYENGTSSKFFETTLQEVSVLPYNLQHIIHDRIHIEKNGVFTTDCIHGSVCRSFLNKEIIDKNLLRFENNIKSLEDRLFIMKYLSLCKSGALVDEYLYHYRMRENSATHENIYRPDLFNERKVLLDKELEIILSNQALPLKERKLLAKTQIAKLWWSVVSHEALLNPNYKKQLNYYRKHGGVENPITFKFLLYLKKQKYSIKRIAMFALIKFKMWGLFKKFLHK